MLLTSALVYRIKSIASKQLRYLPYTSIHGVYAGKPAESTVALGI
jgi:hypothetical protein